MTLLALRWDILVLLSYIVNIAGHCGHIYRDLLDWTDLSLNRPVVLTC